MSTTLIPPTYYVVKPRGESGQILPTIAQAARAIVRLAPTPVSVSALTGNRTRSLNDAELHDLGNRVRSLRPRPSDTGSVMAVELADRPEGAHH
jgi:hypothetical protein